MIDIKGKNAFITGSSRGVGLHVAIGLAKLGCNIILHGRKIANTNSTLKKLKNYDVNVYQVFGDLSKEKEVQDLIKQVEKLDLKIDILYNNAAIMTEYHIDYCNHSWEEWINTYKVNVIAMYDLCCAFIPSMIANGFGRIVNLTSGIQDQPELAPYSASKWAVRKLTEDLASKVHNTGVRINSLDPGWLKTDMGGANAENEVEAVLPGALVPALIENKGPNGKIFSAIKNIWIQ